MERSLPLYAAKIDFHFLPLLVFLVSLVGIALMPSGLARIRQAFFNCLYEPVSAEPVPYGTFIDSFPVPTIKKIFKNKSKKKVEKKHGVLQGRP